MSDPRANRAAIVLCLHAFAAAALIVLAFAHPLIIVKALAAIGATVSAIFVAYWAWWYRFYKRQR